MNTRIEAVLMISAGALFSAGAHFGPALGDQLYEAITNAYLATPETTPVWNSEHDDLALELDHAMRIRVLPCQNIVNARGVSNNASMTSRDDRGGFTVSIVDGELKKIEAEGQYTLEEEGDAVRIHDADGEVVFEINRSNPSLDSGILALHAIDNPLFALVAPPSPAMGASLGAQLARVDDAMAAQLGINTGVVVDFVIPGSGADAGVLQQYDVIVSLGDEPVDAALLTEIISALEPGDSVELGLLRGGKHRALEIELGSAPSQAPAMNRFRFNTGDLDELKNLHRMLEQQNRLIQPAPPARPSNPDAIDASDMAPKYNSRSFPA